MCRNVTFDVATQRLAIFLGKREDLFKCPVIEIVFQFIGKIGVFSRLMLGSPWESVIRFPLFLEGLTVASPCPELRFFQVDDIDSCIDNPLDMHLLHVFQEIQGRNNVWHHLTMPNGIAFHFYLSFIQMRLAVPFSCEVILVATPCDAGHELGLITPFLPRPDTFLNRIITDYIERIASHPIDHDNVCPIVHQLVPRMGRLEGSMIIYPVLQVDRFNDTFQRTTIGCRLYFMERTIPIASETLGDWVIIICHDRFSIFQDKFSISLLLVHLIKIGQMPDEDTFKLDPVGTGFRSLLQLF